MKRVVVDWGSSNFRAYRFDEAGAISARHQADAGILTVREGAFEAVLEREIGAWIDQDTQVLLSGMITSRNGWVETPYLETPATLHDLAAKAVERRARSGASLHFLPGICARHPQPDVMRGEEIQVFGAIAPAEDALIVLPGTHSKWVNVRAGSITGFATFLTGEMFALLRQHSIIGRLIPPGPILANAAAFCEGVTLGFSQTKAGLLNDIFTTRAGALLGFFSPDTIAERLSGILIGHEIKAGLTATAQSGLIPRLVGEAGLVARYQAAFAALGLAATTGPDHAAVLGFARLGLLDPPSIGNNHA
jgi:2-dehydro-3-deoxygalactonokinase